MADTIQGLKKELSISRMRSLLLEALADMTYQIIAGNLCKASFTPNEIAVMNRLVSSDGSVSTYGIEPDDAIGLLGLVDRGMVEPRGNHKYEPTDEMKPVIDAIIEAKKRCNAK